MFAAVVSLAVLQYSFRHGRLVSMPSYDDIGYMADGVDRLQSLYDDGVPGLVRRYKEIPPHSPYQTAMAVAAFALFGYHDWAPYALNSLLALTYFLTAGRLLRGLALWERALCLAFLATIPFMGMAVHEFRPDHAVTLFTTIGAFLLLSGPFVYGPRRRQVAAGVWFGIAMLTKPPVFPQTLALGAVALVLATLSDWLASARLPRPTAVARAWAAVLIPFVLIPLPHYAYNHAAIIAYIHDILFGAYKHTYEVQGTTQEHLAYYLTGPGGKIMLGHHVWLLLWMLAIGGAGIAMLGKRGDRVRLAAMMLLVAVAWLIPTLNKTKQYFFGLGFATTLAFTVLFILGRLLLAARTRRYHLAGLPTLFIAVFVGMGIWYFQWPIRYGNVNAGWQEQRRQIVLDVFDTIVRHCNFHHLDTAPLPDPTIPDADKVDRLTPIVMFCGIGDLNPPLLQYLAAVRQVPMQFRFNASGTRVEDFLEDFRSADFIFAAQSNTLLMAGFLPGSSIQDDLLAAVRARPEFEQVGQWSFMKANGRSMYLFMRHKYRGFVPLKNLGDVEGPFVQVDNDTVRWGYGPATTLSVPTTVAGRYELFWEGRADYPDEVVTVKLDGREIARQPVIGSYTQFSPAHIPLELTAGQHEIELDYTHWHTTDAARPMAVLFKQLQVYRPDGK